ncbi:threonine/serine exporter [Desulfovibrio desulfuricans]|uniref:Threonine/serine exporter n=2 Tax=Desulfovibrio desulfuricans TaxID=876 RepID=A0A4V1CXD5_DESDE|nr:threonine/serine exporter [Desulfovibrio desulfuricans]
MFTPCALQGDRAMADAAGGMAAGASGNAPGVLTAKELIEFIQVFSSTLLGAGGQTTRVDRTACRIARAYGFEVELAIFPKHLMLSVIKPAEGGIPAERRTAVSSIVSGAPNFQRVAALNALSWSIADENLSLDEARQRFSAICAVPTINPVLLRFLVSCANAAFCGLFNGDLTAMGLVFCATLLGFYLRQKLLHWGLDVKVTFFLCAFAASLLASVGIVLQLGGTPQTAIAASVLFLIPGIPLINAMLDILDGHVLMGVSRLIQASTLIICIALGLATTMLLMGVDSL